MVVTLKGVEWPLSKIVTIVICVLVVVVIISFTIPNFWMNVNAAIKGRNIYGECSRWASEEPPFNQESFDKGEYPTLNKTYDGNYTDAKRFCKQET